MNSNIAPCLWFNGQAEDAATHYTALFPKSGIDVVSRYGPGAPFPAGTALMIDFHLGEQRIQALNGGPQFVFSESVSLSVSCADQAEVDHYWNGLIAGGGAPSQCGWLKDRFGLSWQIVPKALNRLMSSGTPAQQQRTMAAMMQMIKLDVAVLEAAHAGD